MAWGNDVIEDRLPVSRTIWRYAAAAIALLVVTLVTRTYGRAFETIDWDENTFLVIAQDVLRGHLPYVFTFDNKPPGMALVLAAVLALFGQSVAVVRGFADGCVLVLALMVFGIGRRYVDDLMAWAIAAALVATLCLIFALYASAELLAAVPLTGALWVLLARGDRPGASWSVGLLISLATLVRTNLGLVAIAVGLLYVTAVFVPARIRLPRRGLAGYVIAGLVPPLALVAVYAVNGQLRPLWLGLVAVPLSYAADYPGLLKDLDWLQFNMFALGAVWASLYMVLWIVATIGLLLMLLFRPVQDGRARDAVIVLAMFVAAFVSTLSGGTFQSHYLIQFLPLDGAAIALFTGLRRLPGQIAVGFFSLLIVAAALVKIAPDSWTALTTPTPMPAEDAARAIAADWTPGDRVWAIEHHLVLFYLDTPPVSPVVTHPDNIARASVLGPLVAAGYADPDELGRILASAPRYVVMKDDGPLGYFAADAQQRIEAFLRDYEPFYAVPSLQVLKRRRG